ncbi:hypothetical protein [Streptomyces sp. CB03911]|uniref:deazapurine DNA modification protein DpdA family protein n=1 Tax=Streptomyces sp. CB03911 TaxID=1804758 RepID=UPI00093DA891|nr:hypothetical protein [Streptomyces sp. CB03911]OKI19294.1 hypothetical protein A6A07_07270 [Streptomyces sp. CB03911]
MRFYLGTHIPAWLAKTEVPLFVSHRRLKGRKTLPRAMARWALDSGGFTELSMHGRWTVTAREYATAVRRYRDEIGLLDWAAPQDWMCEPWIVAKTGLSVLEHQRRTVTNYLELAAEAPDLPIVPVLQGWDLDDYRRCVDLYAASGVDLRTFPTVGIGSVCRRQATAEIGQIVHAMADEEGLRLHGFGVKSAGLRRYAQHLSSADSMAWSFRGRHVEGCTATHKTEANCAVFAMAWRRRALGLTA